LFAELLPLEVEYRRHRGDVPRAEDYAGRFPGLSPVAEEVFAALPPADTPLATVHVSTRRPPPGGLPDVAGYEVLAELGRGGMGVVFKARQLPLRRLVALKMILAGDFASPDHRARFLVEGEMLARLHHPNVVQVYEVGHHEGKPFLALEYVE